MSAFVPTTGGIALASSTSLASAAVTTRSSRFIGAFAPTRVSAPFATFCMQVQDDQAPEVEDMELDAGPPPAPEVEKAKLFIGNLSWDSTDQSLGEAFAEFGHVVESKVVVDKFTGKSRGFGFIEFAEAHEAAAALEGMNGCEVDGRPVRIDRANKRTPPPRRNFY